MLVPNGFKSTAIAATVRTDVYRCKNILPAFLLRILSEIVQTYWLNS